MKANGPFSVIGEAIESLCVKTHDGYRLRKAWSQPDEQ